MVHEKHIRLEIIETQLFELRELEADTTLCNRLHKLLTEIEDLRKVAYGDLK